MSSFFAQSELGDLIEQVNQGERLNFAAGVRLIESKDLLALGFMANLIRERKNGNKTFFVVSQCINHSNVPEEQHPLGVCTNATMYYGHFETTKEQIDHLLQLRELQDKTAGFLTFTPHPFYAKDTQLEGNIGAENTTGFEDLKMLAVSRILLDNFDHIQAFWINLGSKLAQVSLNFGVDALNGTVIDVHTNFAAGTQTEQAMSKKALVDLIEKAGRDAVECDALYHIIRVYPNGSHSS